MLYLNDKVDPNVKDDLGRTALILACENEHLLVIHRFLNHSKLDVNAKWNNGDTVLIWASEKRSCEHCLLLN